MKRAAKASYPQNRLDRFDFNYSLHNDDGVITKKLTLYVEGYGLTRLHPRFTEIKSLWKEFAEGLFAILGGDNDNTSRRSEKD